MDDCPISPFPHILQDGTNFPFEVKAFLYHSSLHPGKVPLESFFSHSKNLHERASLKGLFFSSQSAIAIRNFSLPLSPFQYSRRVGPISCPAPRTPGPGDRLWRPL